MRLVVVPTLCVALAAAACTRPGPDAPSAETYLTSAEMRAAGERLGATMTDTNLEKLDLELRQLSRDLIELARAKGTPATARSTVPRVLYVLVVFRGPLEDLHGAGFKSGTATTSSITGNKSVDGDVAPERLGDLAAIEHVLSVALAPEVHTMMD